MHSAPAAKLVPQLFANTKEVELLPVIAMPVIVTAADPELVITTVCDPLDEPTFTDPKERLVAENVTGGFSPVPLSAMVCGDPLAVSEMVTVAVAAPVAVGAKCPWIKQFAPAARVVPQLLANTNSVAFVPETAMLVNVKVAVPVLVSVTESDALVNPTVVAANDNLVADRVTGGSTPIPLNAIVSGELSALLVMLIEAVSAPPPVGAKCP